MHFSLNFYIHVYALIYVSIASNARAFYLLFMNEIVEREMQKGPKYKWGWRGAVGSASDSLLVDTCQS